MRRLEFKDAKSHKFWELVVEGDSFTVRYGKVGTSGQTQTKTFASPDKAKSEGEKKLASKLKKGYAEVQVDASAVAARDADKAARNPQLEAAIFDDHTDAAAWQVYGDWLQQQQDPHGELILLGLQRAEAKAGDRAKLDARMREINEEQRKTWLAAAAKLIDKADGDMLQVDLTWEHGYVVSASITGSSEEPDSSLPTPDKVARALIKSPAVAFLRELHLGPTYDDDMWMGVMDKTVAAITKAGKLEALTKLVVTDPEHYWDISSTSVGKIGAVLPIAPRLRELHARGGQIQVDKLEHNKLEHISLETPSLDRASVRALGKCKLPQVERLEVYFGADERGASGDIDDLRPLFTNEDLPKLRHLALKNAEFQDEIAQEIATSPLLKQLRTLDMSLGTMHEPGARAILKHARNFAHLERLDLSDNFIPDELCAQLRAALPTVELELGGQEEPSEWGGRQHYYVSVSE